MDEVYKDLYVGDMMAATCKDVLVKSGITHIINMAASEGIVNKFPSTFKYLKINLNDSNNANIASKFEEAIQFIKKAL